jgi:hypothetical protein
MGTFEFAYPTGTLWHLREAVRVVARDHSRLPARIILPLDLLPKASHLHEAISCADPLVALAGSSLGGSIVMQSRKPRKILDLEGYRANCYVSDLSEDEQIFRIR